MAMQTPNIKKKGSLVTGCGKDIFVKISINQNL